MQIFSNTPSKRRGYVLLAFATLALLISLALLVRGRDRYSFKSQNIEDKAVVAQAAALFSGWEVGQYNKPQIIPGANELLIKGENRRSWIFFRKPIGIVFRKKIEGSGVFIVEVKGEPLLSDNAVSLRLRLNDDTPVWMNAPSGTSQIRVSGGKEVELLFYADRAFSYSLHSLAVSPCQECFDDQRLKALLLRDIAGLQEALLEKSTLPAARLLLQWASSVSDFGSGLGDLPDAPIFQATSMDAGQMYSDIWLPNAFGSSCGGFADFYTKVLKLFGIESFTIDIGVNSKDSLTHVTTVVAEKEVGRWKFYIFDPTFNGTYQDKKSGENVDVETILALYGKGKDNEFSFVSKQFERTLLMPRKSLNGFRNKFKSLGSDLRCYDDSLREDQVICDNVPYDLNVGMRLWNPPLKKHNVAMDRDLIVQFLRSHVFSIEQNCSKECQDDFHRLLDKFDIPVENEGPFLFKLKALRAAIRGVAGGF